MAYEHKEGSGALFQNDKKGNQKAPDYKGDIMIAGNMFEIAGWKRLTSKGDPMLSLSAKVKAPRQDQPAEPTTVKPASSGPFSDFNSDIPF